MILMETIHQRLLEARRKAGYVTATEAADAHGWTVPTYLAHENGTRGVSMTKARIYARAYRVTLEWLVNGRGAPPGSDGDAADRAQVIRGIKLGLQFAGIAADSVQWHEAIANAIREYDALSGELPAPPDRAKGKNIAGVRRR
jgi:hypothetical protein